MDALLEPAIINSKEKKQRQRNIIFFNKDIKYLEKKIQPQVQLGPLYYCKPTINNLSCCLVSP